MRALVCRAYGPPETLALETIPDPVPGADDVLIDVGAAGVNFPDVLLTAGKYQRQPPFPFSPGMEIAGTIAAVGSAVTQRHVGERVIAFADHGGFAERVAVPAVRTLPLPATLDMITGAAFLVTYGTALHALSDRGRLQKGETVLVLGAAGGVGIACIEVAKALGGRVIAAASSADKLSLCKAAGADDLLDYSGGSYREKLRALAGEGGIDVACDPVGGPLAEPTVRSMGWGGRYLVLGFAQGEIPRIALNLPLLKGCAIVGVAWGAFLRRNGPAAAAHLSALMALAERGVLRPRVTATYPLARAPEALRALAERTAKGKLVITVGSGLT